MEDFYFHSDVVRRFDDISKMRYFVARRERNGTVDHIYVCARAIGQGVDIKVGTVEGKEMESGRVSVRADQILSDIAATGRAAIYGILFDTDETQIKPESKPILDELAKALNQNRQMNLLIVGHTDDVGTAEYNLELSLRRAKAVLAALRDQYGIESKRLAAYGVGLLCPVASNKSEEIGRAHV